MHHLNQQTCSKCISRRIFLFFFSFLSPFSVSSPPVSPPVSLSASVSVLESSSSFFLFFFLSVSSLLTAIFFALWNILYLSRESRNSTHFSLQSNSLSGPANGLSFINRSTALLPVK